MKENKIVFKILVIFVLVIITVLTVSYGFLRIETEKKNLKVIAGVFKIDFKDGETIKLENTQPLSDSDGMNTTSYDFTIENTGDVDAVYTLRLEKDSTLSPKEILNKDQIKYSIKIGKEEWSKPELLSTLLSGEVLVEEKEIKPKVKLECSIKLWVDENVGNEGQNKKFSGKLVLEATQNTTTPKEEIKNTTSPIIILKGNISEYVEQGKEYIDPGVKEVKDDKDELNIEDVEKKVEFYNGETTEEVEEVNTDNIGVYYITYKIKDSDENEGVIVRSVNVYKKDTEPSTIELIGQERIEIEQDSSYEDEGATASDNGKDISDKIVVVGKVNTKVPGTYQIKYIVEDNSGNTASVTRTVIVKGRRRITVTFKKGEEVKDIGSDRLSCEVLTGEDSCEIKLPTITPSDKSYTTYWSENQEDHEGENPNTTITVENDTTYYALVKKEINVEYEKQEGVSEIGKEKDSCTKYGGNEGCEVELPTITSLPGFNTGYWSTEKEGKSGFSPKTKVLINQDTKYYALAVDTTRPVCEIVEVDEQSIKTNEKIDLTIKCHDTSGKITSTMTKDNLTARVENIEQKNVTKELSEKREIEDGIEYILSLSNFETGGRLSLSLDSGVVKDTNGNTNSKVDLETKVTIIKELKATFEKSDGVDSIGEESAVCNLVGEETSCKVELPTITSKVGYNEGFWTEDKTLNEGKKAGEEIEINKNTTYYAKALDTTPPVCKLVSATPEEATTEEDVTVEIECTDSSGSLNKNMTTDNLTIKVEEEIDTPTKKELTSTSEVVNGKRYKFTLSGFSNPGKLSLIVVSSSVTDKSNNGNVETVLTTEVVIKVSGITVEEFQQEATNSCSNTSYTSSTAEQKHQMYCFSHSSTSQLGATTDYRYIGSDPYNYVKFNNELWRIIGIFTDPSASEGKTGTKKIKLMRDQSIGHYAWNSNSTNNWNEPSTLNTELNGNFWNGLGSEQSKIENMKWYLGAMDRSFTSYISQQFFQYERGSTESKAGGGISSTGHVGLMYPSDYGYTYANGVDNTCYTNPYKCSSSNPSKGWIFNSTNQWAITSSSYYKSEVFFAYYDGIIKTYSVGTNSGIESRPVVYLKSSTKITGGNGTNGKPYILNGDISNPSCEIVSAEPKSLDANEKVTLKIRCTDEASNLTSTMTKDNIKVYANGIITEPTEKTLSTPSTIDKGLEYTLTLSKFNKAGNLSISIDADVVKNATNTPNLYTTLKTDVNINKKVTINYIKKDGVDNISKESDTCTISGGASNCEITLPEITEKKGCSTGFWSNNEQATSGIKESTIISVSDDTTYYAKAIDSIKPVCKLNTVSSSCGATTTGKLDVIIDCSDTSGILTKDLTANDLMLKINSEEAIAEKSITNTNIEDGKRYTVSLSNFNKTGSLLLTLKDGAVTDAAGNTSRSTTLNLVSVINNPYTNGALTLVNKANSSGNKDYNASSTTEKQQMYCFNQNTLIPELSNSQTIYYRYSTDDYRYIGKDPNNYIKFNNETWRIVGIFTTENESGKQEQRIKIIRDENLGYNLSWDNKDASNGAEDEYGKNDWTTSKLEGTLNGIYYNGESGTCYSGFNNATIPCDFRNIGLNATARNQIEESKWYLGANSSVLPLISYVNERSTKTYNNSRPTTFINKVGLMYSSDYPYTFGYGVNETCYENTNNCDAEKAKTSWLYSGIDEWMITSNPNTPDGVSMIKDDGKVYYTSAVSNIYLRPVVYLKANVNIIRGNGSKDNPYTISG